MQGLRMYNDINTLCTYDQAEVRDRLKSVSSFLIFFIDSSHLLYFHLDLLSLHPQPPFKKNMAQCNSDYLVFYHC